MTDWYSAVATLPQRANLKRDALQPLALVGGRLPRPILIEPGRPELLRTCARSLPPLRHSRCAVGESKQPTTRAQVRLQMARRTSPMELPAPRAAWGGCRAHRRGARDAGGASRQHGLGRTRRARRAATHHAGGRDGVPEPGAREAAAAGADGRSACLHPRARAWSFEAERDVQGSSRGIDGNGCPYPIPGRERDVAAYDAQPPGGAVERRRPGSTRPTVP